MMPDGPVVAIIGASSHVAKNLIAENSERGAWTIVAVGRNTGSIGEFTRWWAPNTTICGIEEFFAGTHLVDAIINCVGFGTPGKVKDAGLGLFSLTEDIDNRILALLSRHPGIRYINFSSGAVYGTSMERPVEPGFKASLDVSPLNSAEFYRISKLQQEAKHRSCPEFTIVDVRLFSFFSQFIDRSASYLMNDVLNALDDAKPLVTSRAQLFRDYISPRDLFRLVEGIVSGKPYNGTVDSYSQRPVEKTELLDFLTAAFGLRVTWGEPGETSPTGAKPYYYSADRTAEKVWGYVPLATSLDAIAAELSKMGHKRRGGSV